MVEIPPTIKRGRKFMRCLVIGEKTSLVKTFAAALCGRITRQDSGTETRRESIFPKTSL